MTSYSIQPGVTDSGEPTWELYKEWAFPPFSAGGSAKLATNADRSVLEKAIEHLKGSSSAAGGQS